MNHDPADQLWSQIENDGTQEAPESMNAAQTESADNDVITNLERERDEFKDMYMRSVAEAQNIQRRAQVDVENSRKFATENLVVDILPVLDNFERTLAAIENGATFESVADGVKMVERMLRSALASVKVERISSLGEFFDPNLHEAITSEENTGREPGTVIGEVEPGYVMSGRVIRPARVRVAR